MAASPARSTSACDRPRDAHAVGRLAKVLQPNLPSPDRRHVEAVGQRHARRDGPRSLSSWLRVHGFVPVTGQGGRKIP